MILVLRVGSPELDLDACLKWIPREALQRSWRVGDRRPGGRLSASAGFNLLLAESDDAQKALRLAEDQFDEVAPHLGLLARRGYVEVDIGFFVGELPRSVRIPKEFASKMTKIGIEIVVTAYPDSEDDEQSV